MINNLDNPNGNKRALKKIRKPVLNRQVKDNDEPTDIDPATRHLNGDKTFLINSCLGLVEQDRKIRIGTQFINLHFDVASSVIEAQSESSSITMSLKINENKPIIPWQYAAKRLESYGDADLKAWSLRIEEYHVSYPKIMAKYYEFVASPDPQVCAFLQKAKLQARLACREIERNYSFRKLLTFSNKESTEILSSSYSESFLEEIGHNIEDFTSWTKENGLPSLFDSDCSAHLDVAKNFLDCMPLKGEPVQQGPKYKTFLYNKEGSKQEVEAQYFNVIEPTPEGLFVSGYFTMRKKIVSDKEDSNVKKVRVLDDQLPKFLAVTTEDSDSTKSEENESSEKGKSEEKIAFEESK